MNVISKGLPDTVMLDESAPALVIIDQTLLPCEMRLISLYGQGEIWDAIKTLKVRGAPAIGVAAGIALYLAAHAIMKDGISDTSQFLTKLAAARDYLASSRPTAVNLFWALERMYKCDEAKVSEGASVKAVVDAMCDECKAIRVEDIASSRAIGEYGLTLLFDGCGILTHCNAGQLATVRYGTALAPIHVGREKGMNFKVYCDETRPLLQGARLSAYELCADGVDTTVICDNMASQVMKDGKIDAIIDGGPCEIGIESTVIDLTGEVPMILRPGYMTAEDFQDRLGMPVIMDPALNKKPEDPDFHPKAPGMKYKHYAPKAPMIIFEGDEVKVLEAIEREKNEHEMEGENVVVLEFGENGAIGAAHELFAKLREADREHADIILAAALPQKGVGFSVMNRMLKSAGFNIRKV